MHSSATAGIIIIGNEILSGKVRDENSYYLACELRSLGVEVRKISVIPDEIEAIGREAADFSGWFNYVFTSGGVGPTHDDITMEGIAKGFGVNLAENHDIKKMLIERYEDPGNRAVLKMAMVPEGSEVIFRKGMRFPVVAFRNVFIFPGIPEYLRNKFPVIKERFRSPAFYLRKLYLNSHESKIAGILNSIVNEYADVMFGSYPVLGQQDYRILVTAESRSEDKLEKAVSRLASSLPKNIVVRIE